jgi:hypothetical protein
MLWLYFYSTGTGLLVAAVILIVLQYRALVSLERIADTLDRIEERNREPKSEARPGKPLQ